MVLCGLVLRSGGAFLDAAGHWAWVCSFQAHPAAHVDAQPTEVERHRRGPVPLLAGLYLGYGVCARDSVWRLAWLQLSWGLASAQGAARRAKFFLAGGCLLSPPRNRLGRVAFGASLRSSFVLEPAPWALWYNWARLTLHSVRLPLSTHIAADARSTTISSSRGYIQIWQTTDESFTRALASQS
jgi:hypothetical protein